MALPGTKVIVHENPSKRASWDLNGDTGWCVGPSMNHYCWIQCFIPRTRSVVDSDKVEFFPHSIPFPSVTLKDMLTQAATDIMSILSNLPKTTVPSIQDGEPINNKILDIAKHLKRICKIPDLKYISDIPLPRLTANKTKKIPLKIIKCLILCNMKKIKVL